MIRLARMVGIASALAMVLPLAACADFDPQDALESVFSSQKKPLTGERKALFPEGTPGVQQGVPQDLVKGYQPPPDAAPSASAATPDDQAPPPKPKAKPKPKVAAAPASAPAAPTPAPAPEQTSPWPTSSGQVAWPDPPAPVAR